MYAHMHRSVALVFRLVRLLKLLDLLESVRKVQWTLGKVRHAHIHNTPLILYPLAPATSHLLFLPLLLVHRHYPLPYSLLALGVPYASAISFHVFRDYLVLRSRGGAAVRGASGERGNRLIRL
jgi:hypothetical protein